jgi:hypothetical protein
VTGRHTVDSTNDSTKRVVVLFTGLASSEVTPVRITGWRRRARRTAGSPILGAMPVE